MTGLLEFLFSVLGLLVSVLGLLISLLDDAEKTKVKAWLYKHLVLALLLFALVAFVVAIVGKEKIWLAVLATVIVLLVVAAVKENKWLAVATVTVIVLLLVFLVYSSTGGGGGGDGHTPSMDPLQEQDAENSKSREQVPFEDCHRVNRADSEVKEGHLIHKLKYRIASDPGVVHELNIVEELAADSYWRAVAEVLGKNPNIILDKYKLTEKEETELARRLLDEVHKRGYRNRFGWNAYIEGFSETGPLLSRAVEKLEAMLECLGIDRKQNQAVTRRRFGHMKCDKDGTTLRLEEEVAPHWKSVAKTFDIKESLFHATKNIPELCAEDVLKKLHQSGYNGTLGWQGILDALKEASLREAGMGKLVSTLNEALDCVVE